MTIQLNDRLYDEVKRRAAAAGFSTVDDYVADVLSHDVMEDVGAATPNLDHLFTPERIAEINDADDDISAGNFYTADQVREHFKQKRATWGQNDQG